MKRKRWIIPIVVITIVVIAGILLCRNSSMAGRARLQEQLDLGNQYLTEQKIPGRWFYYYSYCN